MKKSTLLFTALLSLQSLFAQFNHHRVYSTFDNMSLAKSDSFNNGSDLSGGFSHYGRHFNNSYDTTWSSWNGWALSNMRDDSTTGYFNQHSCIAGHGLSYTPNYMVAYYNPNIRMDTAQKIYGTYICNSTYVYYEIKEGSAFSKKFGGDDGTDPDYFKVMAHFYLEGELKDSSEFYLADFRFGNDAEDYILDDWTYWNFDQDNDFVRCDSIAFSFASSDNDQWGMVTPAYFCMDDLNALGNEFFSSDAHNNWLKLSQDFDTFYKGDDGAGGMLHNYLFFPNHYNTDWNSWNGWSLSNMRDTVNTGFENEFSTVAYGSSSSESVGWPYFVSYGTDNEIRTPYLDDGNHLFKKSNTEPLLLAVSNSVYAYHDMLNGSAFSKKFGGDDGSDPDYFRLIVNWLDAENTSILSDTVYLADFRFEDDSEDYILKEWKGLKTPLFDLENHPEDVAHKIQFKLESSDNSFGYMNTPAYFCLSQDFFFGSVASLKKETVITLYPNPAENHIRIQSASHIEKCSIYNMSGLLLIESDTTDIDISSLTPGMYFVRVLTENGIGSQKFIKQ